MLKYFSYQLTLVVRPKGMLNLFTSSESIIKMADMLK